MLANPVARATLQATALSMISNIIGQIVRAYDRGHAFTINPTELLRFATMTLLTSPPNYKWQQLLERTFPAYQGSSGTGDDYSPSLPLTEKHKRRDSNPKDKMRQEQGYSSPITPIGGNLAGKKLNLRNTFFKWFIDCITLGTFVNTTVFVVIMAVLKGYSVSQILQSVQTETMPIILAGYKVWPVVSIISFSFVPVERRIVFLSSVGLLWGVYMSLVAARV